MNIDQVLNTFIAESHELLETMEDLLLKLENDLHDKETIHALFRAAHTIKGSSGMFGFEPIVKFTHAVETLLDLMRNDQLEATSGLVAELLVSRDHIAELIEHLAVQNLPIDDEKLAYGEMLVARLNLFKEPDAAIVCQPESVAPAASETEGDTVSSDLWYLSLRCNSDVLKQGNDPMKLIGCLEALGDIVHIRTLTEQLPALDQLEPENLYLGFEIALRADVEKSEIEEVFEWVADECTLKILPPKSKVSDYIQLIHSLPEDPYMLGEILISSGVITRKELDRILIEQTQKTSAEPAKPLGEILVAENLVPPKVIEVALERQKQAREVRQQDSHFIRVNASKLDQLINLVGELVISSASIQEQARVADQSTLIETTATIGRLVEEVRDSALKLRMVEIGETFQRFNRVVRDVSKELGKDIRLEILGAETELDKTLVEKISDPLVHLVRNAMDHGIESQAQRVAVGKSAQGTIRLNAYHESGSVVIEVIDDGGGLRKERILQKAIDKGLVTAGHHMTDQEIYGLIFEAGFSTAEQVTNLSGRGVGMDVVRRNIESLRGSVEIDSEAHKGTTVRIRLPLTLAIIDGFLVTVGHDVFVVPLDIVVECVELEESVEREKQYINLRNQVLPFVRLQDHFNLTSSGNKSKRENVVVVKVKGQSMGLVVDSLLGEHQTVIKPLGTLFRHVRGIGGSTILGNGDVALILDVPSLYEQVSFH